MSAPSDLAVEAAERLGLTLVGFLRGDGFNVYAHPERIAIVRRARASAVTRAGPGAGSGRRPAAQSTSVATGRSQAPGQDVVDPEHAEPERLELRPGAT